MSQNVLQHEPHLALFVEDDDALLFYKKIIDLFAKKGSKIYFELNPLTAHDLKNHCDAMRFKFRTETRHARQMAFCKGKFLKILIRNPFFLS
jgi:methylase of polypeptide subunit release factors